MREDLRKIVEDNWEDIQALIIEKTEAEQKPKTIWDFNTNDRDSYYYIDEYGYLRPDWFDEGYFEIRRDAGNAFLTEEEAEFERERRKIEAVMRRYARPFVKDEANWIIEYQYQDKEIYAYWYGNYHAGAPCFESEEIAEKVIEEIGEDRLLKYWFGVKE